MQEELTTFLLNFTLTHKNLNKQQVLNEETSHQTCQLTSKQILQQIFMTINSTDNYRQNTKHKLSICNDQTGFYTQTKCNCKKSKCLKLYCECFAQGSFCQNCSCDSCQNSQKFSEVRAKAIDEMIMRSSINFGQRGSSIKGCNCRKTQCLKKYCQCFNVGQKCGQYCKCKNCSNTERNPQFQMIELVLHEKNSIE